MAYFDIASRYELITIHKNAFPHVFFPDCGNGNLAGPSSPRAPYVNWVNYGRDSGVDTFMNISLAGSPERTVGLMGSIWH